jgi:hypothetical protein
VIDFNDENANPGGGDFGGEGADEGGERDNRCRKSVHRSNLFVTSLSNMITAVVKKATLPASALSLASLARE